jgi:proteasome accessory factor B
VQPTLVAEEPAFESMWQATVHRTPVQFDYSRAGQRDATTRHVEPWGVVTAQGRWYVAGLDTDRGEPRLFRLSRIVSEVMTTGEPGSFTVPEGTDLRAMSASLAPREPDCSAVVLARSGAANGLRRRAAVTATGVTGPDGTPGWDQLDVPYVSEADFAGELLGYADVVVVESPDELRAAVRDRLSSVLAGGAR